MKRIFDEPHIRKNILTGENVLVSPQRTKRPWQGKLEEREKQNKISYDPSCYLCPGNIRASNKQTPNYKDTLVFINDYSALSPETEQKKYQDGLLEAHAEKGICKVICFSPDHSLTIPTMQVQNIIKLISLWQKEYMELGSLKDINHVQIFENKGVIMGCSNTHPHGQIWAQNGVPTEVQKKSNQFLKYWNLSKRSLLQDYLEQEEKLDERIIASNEHFVALVPYWAVWPYETMIIPRKKIKHIGILNGKEKTAYAEILKLVTTLYDNIFNISFPYSAGIHQAPTDGQEHKEWHFHMSFYPPLLRSSTVKKFMVGYEMFAGPQRDITAEQAATTLKGLSSIHYSLE